MSLQKREGDPSNSHVAAIEGTLPPYHSTTTTTEPPETTGGRGTGWVPCTRCRQGEWSVSAGGSSEGERATLRTLSQLPVASSKLSMRPTPTTLGPPEVRGRRLMGRVLCL